MIFVDTGAWYASLVPTDPDHPKAVQWLCSCYELMEEEMDRIYKKPWRELARREDQKNDR